MKNPILVFIFVILLILSINYVFAGEKAYIANKNAGNVSVIDVDTANIVDTIPVGFQPESVAASENGARVFVLNKGDKTISVIDTSSNIVINTIDIAHEALSTGTTGSEIIPKEIVASPMGDVVYVADEFATLLVVNVDSGEITEISSFTTNLESPILFGVIDISPTGDFFYTKTPDGIGKFDATTFNIVGNFDIATPITALVVTDDGSKIYSEFTIPNFQIINTASFIVDEFSIAGAFLRVPLGISVPPPLTVSPDNRILYIIIEASMSLSQTLNSVAAIDMEDRTLLGTVPVGENPTGIDITFDGGKLVVPNSGDNTVTIIDAQTFEVLSTIPVGPTPRAYRRFISKGSSSNSEAELHLASLGVTVQQAKDFIFANADSPEVIFDVALQFNVTTLMLSQITGFSTNDISAFFASFGLDTVKLDI